MTDSDIEAWINKVNKDGHFLLTKEIDLNSDLNTGAETLTNNLDIGYLENELGLVIRLLSENNQVNVIKLSLKGTEILNNGGWIAHKKKLKNRKQKEEIKKNASYWFNIVIPIMSLLVAMWAIKSDSHRNKEDIINEVKELQKEQEKKQQDRIQILSKKVDSVLSMKKQNP